MVVSMSRIHEVLNALCRLVMGWGTSQALWMRSKHSKTMEGLPPLALSGAGDWGGNKSYQAGPGQSRSISPKNTRLRVAWPVV